MIEITTIYYYGMMENPKVPTIKDIAKRANVSIGTVDRVLHNRGNVSSETKKKIEKTIKELKYKPNIYARQLKLAKRYKIGAMSKPSKSSFNAREQVL